MRRDPHAGAWVPALLFHSKLRGVGLACCLWFVLQPTAQAAANRLELSLQPGTVKPGDPLLITVRGAKGTASGSLQGRPLRFYPVHNGFQALTGISVDEQLGALTVKVELRATPAAKPLLLEGRIYVVDPGYPARELRVANKFVQQPAPELKTQLAEDRAAFSAAYAQPLVPPLFRGNFIWPRQSVMTAPFGDLRTFNGKKQSQHYGVDLDGAVGDPIYASNVGKVVMARECYGSGGTILLHHGAGLFTAYFHMSRMDLKVGDLVKAGQRLGKVGKTGRVTGPHLHWGVKVDGVWVDGETLLRLKFF